jgi:hypothetical protein
MSFFCIFIFRSGGKGIEFIHRLLKHWGRQSMDALGIL